MNGFVPWIYIVNASFFVMYILAMFVSDVSSRWPRFRDEVDMWALVAIVASVLCMPVSIAALVLSHQEVIFKAISSYIFIAPALIAGPALYLFRCRLPFVYGVLEVVASWVIILVAIKVSNTTMTLQSLSGGLPLLAKGTGILGGIYVTVRGLDNMDKDMPRRFRLRWDRFYHGKRRSVQPENGTT